MNEKTVEELSPDVAEFVRFYWFSDSRLVSATLRNGRIWLVVQGMDPNIGLEGRATIVFERTDGVLWVVSEDRTYRDDDGFFTGAWHGPRLPTASDRVAPLLPKLTQDPDEPHALQLGVDFLRKEFDDPSIGEDRFTEVRGHEDFVLLFFPQIGANRLLVERTTDRVFALGGGRRVEIDIWAYLKGFKFEDTNTLVVTRIDDIKRVERIFRTGYRYRAVKELMPLFYDLPLAIRTGSYPTWLMLEELLLAELDAVMAFEVNSEPSPPVAWEG